MDEADVDEVKSTQNTAKVISVKSLNEDPVAIKSIRSPQLALSPQRPISPSRLSIKSKESENTSQRQKSPNPPTMGSLEPQRKSINENFEDTVSTLEPQGKRISDHVEELTESIKKLSKTITDPSSPVLSSNVDKIAKMSKILTGEANALRQSIKSLSADIARTKGDIAAKGEDVNFPYHLFLIELIVNKIHMKCDCFDLDYNNLVISASFLGKKPIVLYDSSYGKIDNFTKINVGKSTLFAMTYDKICSIKEFEILLQLTKEPPCTTCVTKIAETRMDYTNEFIALREELCKKWAEEKPKDDIICTSSTSLSKNMFYLSCGESNPESIGVIEMSFRISFLGKEITTAFCTSPKPKGTTTLLKEDNGMTMYSCQKVEMDDQGKILLDEDVLANREPCNVLPTKRTESPISQCSYMPVSSRRSFDYHSYSNRRGDVPRYDEIFTKMNDNELKIRVPKSTRVDRNPRYEKIQELCDCEDNPHNTGGEQIQFEMPRELCYPDKTHNTYQSNLKYTYKGGDRSCEGKDKDRRIVNITPSNCPVPVNMEKVVHHKKDVFILKIGKKLETKDKKTDLEIELVTPKVFQEKPPENNIAQQCSSTGLKLIKSKGGKKVNGKKKSKTSLKKGKAKAGKSKAKK